MRVARAWQRERTHMVHGGWGAGCVFFVWCELRVEGRGSAVGIAAALWTATWTVGGAGGLDEADVENRG